MPHVTLALLLAQLAAVPAPPPVTESPPAAETSQAEDDGHSIVVVAERLRAAVAGPVAPEISLDGGAVAALGASNLADILAQISALTGGAQGRVGDGPILLVNGRRIGSFDEVRNLPPEAIQRVDVLPEEAALRLGYPATSKPVNIVLKQRYAAATGELEDRLTTRGLRNDFNTELNLVNIAGDNRTAFNLQYQIGGAITEASRGVMRPIDSGAANELGILANPAGGALLPLPASFAGVPSSGRRLTDFAAMPVADDTGRFHTLVPSTKQFTADGTFACALPGALAFSASAKFDRLIADDLLGPAIADVVLPSGGVSPFNDPVRLRRSLTDLPGLVRQTTTDTYHLGSQLAGYGQWQWSAAGNYDRVDVRRRRNGGVDAALLQSAIDQGTISDPFSLPPAGLLARRPQAESLSHEQLLGADLFAGGPLVKLPAGDMNLSLRGSLSRETISAVLASGETSLDRNRVGGQISLDIPLLRAGSGIGSLDAGVHGSLDRYSDAGPINGYGTTLVWKPVKPISVLLAASRDQGVPTLSQLGDVAEATPDAAFFDYATGRSFVASRIDGGDRALRPDRRTILKAEFAAKPLAGLGLTATFTALQDNDALLAFPGITSATEEALPGRIMRDATGAIIQVDARPINAFRENRQELRLALNFNKSFGKAAGPRVPGGGGFGGGHSFGASGSSVQFGLSDTVRLRDTIRLARGMPEIDLIGANTLGDGLRVPRHRVEAQLSATRNGWGLRANAVWTTGGDAGYGSPGQLTFGDQFQLNFRLFYFPERNLALLKSMPWIKGVRLLLAVDNPFDGYQRVTDLGGGTPLAYQRGLLDPIGRTVRLSIRKTLD